LLVLMNVFALFPTMSVVSLEPFGTLPWPLNISVAVLG
jgi:hypothetical protein